MIFVAKTADFSAKKIKVVEISYDSQDDASDSQIYVTNIVINDPVTEIKQGNKVQFTATAYPENATFKTIRWSCAPTTIASIDQDTGELTATGAGVVTVTAKAIDGSGKTASTQLLIEGKAIDDCAPITKQVLGYYGNHHTDAQAVALDMMIEALGGTTEGSIWNKLDILMLPFLANDINKAFINAKIGKDHMEYPAAGKINANNNSIEWESIYTLENGCVKCLNDSNIKNTLNIPIYRFNNSPTGITGAKFTLVMGGDVSEWTGGTGCMIPITTSTMLYSKNTSTHRIGADFYLAGLKGMSINWVSETEGYENTVFAPVSNVQNKYGSQEILNTFATANNGSPYHWNTYMRCKTQFYTFVLSQYLNQDELNLVVSEIDKLAKVFSVDQSK